MNNPTQQPVTRRLLAIITISLSGMIGCQNGSKSFVNENDRLRREVMNLTEQVESLTAEQRRLTTALANATATPAGIPEGMTPPRLSEVTLGNHSGGIDTDGDGRDDSVRLYVQPTDQRGRMITIIATAEVTITHTHPGSASTTLATAKIDAPTLDQAYRSGLTGTHYTLEIPLTSLPPAGTRRITAHLQLTDLQHGGTVTTSDDLRFTIGDPRHSD